ncbi:hypothetical protein ACGFZQ_10620 [Streptomyces sp. NPDC048254]|uniref:hypothetical protein n=1 Tax=Streptomyces sp. NPDC048254 TaxID=3365525 RepID=UPI0037229B63
MQTRRSGGEPPLRRDLSGLDPLNVRERELVWTGRKSKAFDVCRGEFWMRGPCRGCALCSTDLGGCRRQAYALTADARNTDPARRQAPGHRAVTLRRTTAAAAHRAGGP